MSEGSLWTRPVRTVPMAALGTVLGVLLGVVSLALLYVLYQGWLEAAARLGASLGPWAEIVVLVAPIFSLVFWASCVMDVFPEVDVRSARGALAYALAAGSGTCVMVAGTWSGRSILAIVLGISAWLVAGRVSRWDRRGG